MASVFSYEPDPPKVLSPWEDPPIVAEKVTTVDASSGRPTQLIAPYQLGGLDMPMPTSLSDWPMDTLKPEPQEGPVEYKLHLLLRPRRSFSKMTGTAAVSGSRHYRVHDLPSETGASPPVRTHQTSATAVPTLQTRQNRLQHLTTQLLWRLQQSSPYHSSSVVDLVLPRLPEATIKLGAPLRPEKLLPGLEESRGALYEIGVTDDGALVGVSEDEMGESMTNLRAMAASLGCSVRITRCVVVGHCEWVQSSHWQENASTVHGSSLLVVEALVFPDLNANAEEPHETAAGSPPVPLRLSITSALGPEPGAKEAESSRTKQLRVSLTGRSAAGKSSLLGTLSTSTYDNGRGKSRLSLLKHRHEIATGMTSSVACELVGYSLHHSADTGTASVVNYGCGNVSSWDDIHNTADGGRLVFLTDSAGHPRYRRTTVRGLVSWAPHWTLCCIAGRDAGGSGSGSSPRVSADEGSGQEDPAGSSFAHLELCLELRLPLVVVITKHDLASRDGLRQTLSTILSMIKAKGRKPMLLVKASLASKQHDLRSFSTADQDEVLSAIRQGPSTVPILLTSAVNGSGIRKVHALLCNLPIPPPVDGWDAEDTDTLFHIDEVYSLQPRPSIVEQLDGPEGNTVASGYLKEGILSVGDTVQVGPFTVEQNAEAPKAPAMERTRSNPSRASSSPIPRLSRSMPHDENVRHFTPPPSAPTPVVLRGEFLPAQVISLRNLRLPVKRLLADQAGTIGLKFPDTESGLALRLRKGMVIRRMVPSAAGDTPTSIASYAALRVRFAEKDYLAMEPGALFNLYVASVRVTAKIVTVQAVTAEDSSQAGNSIEGVGWFGPASFEDPLSSVAATQNSGTGPLAGEEQFEMDENLEELELAAKENGHRRSGVIDVIFRFLYSPEWVELGAKLLAMPSHAVEGGVGLEGFVGYIMEAIE